MPASDATRLRAPLVAIMREAGAIAREAARGDLKRWNKETDRSPVSEGDLAVNNFLRVRLHELLPEAGWLSEETAELPNVGPSAPLWIVDPIDGTRGYIAGRADWTISVGLAVEGRPVLAALYAPVTREIFLAAHGQGATRNSAPMSVSGGANLAGARLAGPKRYIDRLAGKNPEIIAKPKVFSLALRLARVAQGELEAAFSSPGSHAWDLAAADLLVHEAGGVMTDFAGRPLRYDRPEADHGALIAAGRARHAALIDLVRDRLAEFA